MKKNPRMPLMHLRPENALLIQFSKWIFVHTKKMKRQLEIFSSDTFVWPFLSYCLPGKSLILTKNKQQKHENSKL